MTGTDPKAVEALLPGDLVHMLDEVVRVSSPARGEPTGYRGIGDPRILVHVYGHAVGDWPLAEAARHARHLSWPAGTVVQVARP